MNKNNKIIAFLVFVFVFSLFSTSQVFAENTIVDVAPFSNETKINNIGIIPILKVENEKPVDSIIPTVTSPKSNENLDGGQIIRGEVKSGYNIKVYIDGKYRTTLNVWPSKTGISGFYYEPIQKLTLGKHNVQFVSFKDGKDYGSSGIVKFNVVSGYSTPDILTPYYYADDPSIYVVRGYGNTGNKIEVYVDDKKVRFIDSLYGTKSSSYFALAVKGLKNGNHKAYILSYTKDTNIVSKSKIIYFAVNIKQNLPTQEIKKDSTTKTESNNTETKNTSKENVKKADVNSSINKTNSAKTNIKENTKTSNNLPNQKEKQDKSILIGVILLILAIILLIFWLISENKEKVKKFIDNLFEEDEDDKDQKDNENK